MTPQTAPAPLATPAALEDRMPMHGIDHVELWVGNAAQAAYFYEHAFGFRRVAYAGLETGRRDRASHVLEQGRIRLVLTGTLGSGTDVARHHALHGDGVRVIALSVPDVEHAYHEALARGARGVHAPEVLTDAHGTVRCASIATYGDTLHTFVDRSDYRGAFLPGYEPVAGLGTAAADDLLLAIDHIVGNVELGHMEEWVGFYERVFGMTEMLHFSDEAISTEYSALMSKVVTSGNGRIKFPINEPAEGKRKSQIDEYLDFYEGAGAQHVAVATRDIVAPSRGCGPVGRLPHDPRRLLRRRRRAGARRRRPARRPARAGDPRRPRRRGVPAADLHQAGRRPATVFFEIIERHGARGFGEGNFKALFEAIEREQDKRGNL
jgi:4-hydroxyphenylpyruvate dioxygenase